MVSLLIPTEPSDLHAIYVKLALKQLGHYCQLWYTSDLPTQQSHSIEISNNKLTWTANGTQLSINHDPFNVVWYRRPRSPVLPKNIHPSDLKNAQKENIAFFNNIFHCIGSNTVWINPITNAKLTNNKILQLNLAVNVGLKIPETLFSNDPELIKKFVIKYKDNTIYKTFCPLAWQEENLHMAYATTIHLNQLPSNHVLQNTPGIYQQKISKAYELRVTYFGDEPIAVKLNSQAHIKGQHDWRAIPTEELSIEPYQLPDEIHLKCQLLMKKLGIIFGCIDMIVTPENEYYFLEINEQGQFIWVEELLPEIKMLNKFTQFILKQTHFQEHLKSLPTLSLNDFSADALAIKEEAIKRHINPAPW